MSDSNDKMYIIVIIGMIFFFVYWYQTRLDAKNLDTSTNVCTMCSKKIKHVKKKEENRNKNKNHVKVKKNKINGQSSPDPRKRKEESKKKNVRFQEHDDKRDNDSISLDSLESSDKLDIENGTDDSSQISLKM